MRHAISTHLFSNHRLTTSWLERIQNAGIEAIEIFCARQHFDYTNREQRTELTHWFRDSSLTLHSLHAPMYTDEVWGRSGPHSVIDITEPVKSRRVEMVDEIKRAVDFAEQVPFQYLVQHIGVGFQEYDLRRLDATFSSLDELTVFSRPRGVEILLENIPNEFSSAERLMSFIGATHLNLGFCFDTGHAHMNEGIANAFAIMKPRIRSTHVHDNDGKEDRHIWPFLGDGGTINWAEAMNLLRSCGSEVPLLLELKERPDQKHPLEDIPGIFERLENAK